jgi:hypothetical protein
MQRPVLRIRIRDPVLFLPLDPGYRIRDGYLNDQDRDPGSGFRMNIPDHISENFLVLKNLNSLMRMRIRISDPESF